MSAARNHEALKQWMAPLHRLAILLAVMVLILIGTGASITSLIRPLPGEPPTTAPSRNPLLLRSVHQALAGIVTILAAGLAIGAPSRKPRISAWASVGLVLTNAVSGIYPPPAVLHAVIAPLLFSSVVVTAVFTSKDWEAPPVTAENPLPPVRRLALWVPIALVAQIALGAAFRHGAIGVVWHILNSMFVVMLILVLSVCVLRQYPGHPALRPAALALLVITGIQVLLGFAVYITLIVVSENDMALIVTGAVHVVTGSLTLASSVVLTLRLGAATEPRAAATLS